MRVYYEVDIDEYGIETWIGEYLNHTIAMVKFPDSELYDWAVAPGTAEGSEYTEFEAQHKAGLAIREKVK